VILVLSVFATSPTTTSQKFSSLYGYFQ